VADATKPDRRETKLTEGRADLVVNNARTAVNRHESVVSIAMHGGKIVAIADPATAFFGATTSAISTPMPWSSPGQPDACRVASSASAAETTM
jgi:hypothetical protein